MRPCSGSNPVGTRKLHPIAPTCDADRLARFRAAREGVVKGGVKGGGVGGDIGGGDEDSAEGGGKGGGEGDEEAARATLATRAVAETVEDRAAAIVAAWPAA